MTDRDIIKKFLDTLPSNCKSGEEYDKLISHFKIHNIFNEDYIRQAMSILRYYPKTDIDFEGLLRAGINFTDICSDIDISKLKKYTHYITNKDLQFELSQLKINFITNEKKSWLEELIEGKDYDKITNVYASKKNLTDIPTIIFNMISIRTLDLSSNNLGTLNPKIVTFTSLISLNLSMTSLVIFPYMLGQLEHLITLNISLNLLTMEDQYKYIDRVKFNKLETLNISGNKLKNINLSMFPNLVEVDLSSNQLTSVRFSNPKITIINIMYNQLGTMFEKPSEKVKTVIISFNRIKQFPPWVYGIQNFVNVDQNIPRDYGSGENWWNSNSWSDGWKSNGTKSNGTKSNGTKSNGTKSNTNPGGGQGGTRSNTGNSEGIPKASSYKDEALRYFGLTPKYTKEELRDKYIELCLIHHPDKGGSHEKFVELQRLYDILR